MRLRELVTPATAAADLEILSVTADSREAGPGALFFAIRGAAQDGTRYIPDVARAEAAAIVGEDPAPSAAALGATAYVQVRDARRALSFAASAIAGHPSRALRMVGVTGTSGKTTTTYLIESILRAAGERVGLIGTIQSRFEGEEIPSNLTTPGPVELQRRLAEMLARGATSVVMEVSSHSLAQRRVADLAFDGMVFTNLSPEHLDYHRDLEDYFGAKSLLFTEVADYARQCGKDPVAAVNLDDAYGVRLAADLRARGFARLAGFSTAAHAVENGISGIHGTVDGVRIDSRLSGGFNFQNILAALTVTRGMGIPNEAIERGLRELAAVPGRLERVADPRGGRHILVDYAHKPDALEKVLRALAPARAAHRLITVFGCGGDRDRTKRPVMGRLAVELSDHVIVTSDNPRTEDPHAIIREIVAGIASAPEAAAPYAIEPDRRRAIEAAIRLARPGDIVLIAGKGHEDYQIIGREKIHFDDREEAARALGSS